MRESINIKKNSFTTRSNDRQRKLPPRNKANKTVWIFLFTLDAKTTLYQVPTTPKDKLFEFKTSNGKSIDKGIQFLYPFAKNKKSWPCKKDIMYWDE